MTWVASIVQGILVGGLIALFACGLSLLFGVVGVINLAHGSMAVAAGYLAVKVAPHLPGPQLVSVVIVVPVFLVVGYFVQRLLLQPSLDAGPLTTLLVTFGLAIVIQNLLLEYFTANSLSLNVGSLVSDSFRINNQLSIAYVSLIILGVAVVVLSGLQLFLSRTPTGRIIRAVADNREAAQLVGADYRHIFGIAAGLAFGTMALAGVALSTYSQIDPSAGANYLIFAFEAVVIGGLGSIWGTLAGGIVLGVAQTIGGQINSADQILAGHLVFLAVLAFRPRGLFSRAAVA
jgi:branched-chain amino acid transport system permease protein